MSSPEDSVLPEQKNRSKHYTSFIDILFAIVIGQTFVILASPQGISTWIAEPQGSIIKIADTILGFALIVTSWIRYHSSVEKFPHKTPIRFTLDLALLLFYFLVFVYDDSFLAVSIIFLIVFSIYSIWNAIRFIEYREQAKEYRLLRRTLQAVGFAVGFLAIVVIQFVSTNMTIQGLCIAGSFALLIGFRGLSYRTSKLTASTSETK